MLAARMHGYRQPLVLEEINIPEISSDQVLVRVGGIQLTNHDQQTNRQLNQEMDDNEDR